MQPATVQSAGDTSGAAAAAAARRSEKRLLRVKERGISVTLIVIAVRELALNCNFG